MKKSICLNMIVKNETRVIGRCLDAVRNWIDYWVIVDTGSTDGTQAAVCEYLRNIPGELYERPWVDFAHNRNEALELARGKADYLLFLDADDELVVEEKLPFLEHDYYLSPHKDTSSSSHCYVVLLAASHLDWRWSGVLHERLQCSQAKTYSILQGVCNFYHEDGCRSQNPKKYLTDIALLEKALEEDPENKRYRFFLAESLRWNRDEKGAITAYRKRAAMGGEPEEVYWSLYCLAKLEKTFSGFCKAYQFRPSRIEPLYELGNLFNAHPCWLLVWLLSRHALHSPLSTDLLYVESWIYDWGMLLQYAISSAKLEKNEEAVVAFKKLLEKKTLPEKLRREILQSVSRKLS